MRHDLFETWSEISAYVFGFWWADGCIGFFRKNGYSYKRFRIKNTDKQIMIQIAEIFGCNLHKGSKSSVEITIYSDQLFDFCYRYVNSTRKSNSGCSLPKIPDEWFWHWLRGFFDGDGSICWKHYKNRHGKITTALQTSFTAGLESGNYIEQIRDKLVTYGLGNKKIIYGKNNKKLVFNEYDSVLLCSKMYKDCNIAMERKKDIWKNVNQDKIMAGKKFFSNKV